MYNDLTEKQIEVFKLFNRAKNWIAVRSVEGYVYNWSNDYTISSFTEFINNLKINKEINKENLDTLFTLPREYLHILGFGAWEEDGEYCLMLLPLWLYAILPNNYEFIGASIVNDNQPYRYTLDKIDNDTRFGCLAYGIYLNGKYPEGSIVKDREDTNDRFIDYRRDSECCEG